MTLQGSLLLLGSLIILALAAYAARLLWLLRQQNRAQRAAQDQRRSELQSQILLIAKACHQEQCEPAEGALRLVNLLRGLPGHSPEHWRALYPDLHALYDKIADHPILDARKALKRNERMRLDLERERWEDQLGPAMLKDLERLLEARWP